MVCVCGCFDQARINSFMKKAKKKKNVVDDESEGVDASGEVDTKETLKLKKQINTLLKKHKVRQVRGIVKAHDSFKSWGQEAQVKVCLITSGLVSLLNAL